MLADAVAFATTVDINFLFPEAAAAAVAAARMVVVDGAMIECCLSLYDQEKTKGRLCWMRVSFGITRTFSSHSQVKAQSRSIVVAMRACRHYQKDDGRGKKIQTSDLFLFAALK